MAGRAAADQRLAGRLSAERPEVLAQVDHAVQVELATTVRDVLIRRTQVFFRDRDQGLTAAPAVAARMAELLGWGAERVAAELAAYAAEVGLSRQWRDEPSAAAAG